LDSADEAALPAVIHDAPWPRPAAEPRRAFGVYIDPWHVDDWARSVGEAPQLVAKFEAFSNRRTIDPWLTRVERAGIRRMLVSWEPWAPVPAAWGTALQAKPQPGYRNVDIARGAQDRYILAFAHEMNGYWYPWSHGSRAYVFAWRRIVRIFDVAHARNVRFVWSVNPNLYESQRAWRRGLRAYWPGSRYVDAVGSTMIDFGGAKSYPVERFTPRLRWLHETYRKPVVLTEVNTAFGGRLAWLADLRSALRALPWVEVVAWSQLPSRGKVHQVDTGTVDWDVQTDPAASAGLAAIIRDGSH
jgi:mannan endo-1,4-beta-mannosidase